MVRPFSYDNQKLIFKYCKIQKRAEMRKFIPCLRTIADQLPFSIHSLHIYNSTDGAVHVVFDDNSDDTEEGNKNPQHAWKFHGSQIQVKKIGEGNIFLGRKTYATEYSQSENLKKFLEFYLNKTGTRILVALLEVFPNNVELTENLTITAIDLSQDFNNYDIFEKINNSISILRLSQMSRNAISFEAVRSAERVEVGAVKSHEELNCVHVLQSKEIILNNMDVSVSEVVNFFKTFAEKDMPIGAKVKINGEIAYLENILMTMKNENDLRWRKTYYKKKESVTLKKYNNEVNIHLKFGSLRLEYMELGEAKLNGPVANRMSRQLALCVYKYLPFYAREEISDAVHEHFGIDTGPVRAQELLVKYENGKLIEAIGDNYKVDDPGRLKHFFLFGCYVRKLHFQGVPNLTYLFSLNVQNLVLETNEPFPRGFVRCFSSRVPDTITATSNETIKNILELTNQCNNVIFMDEETGEPSAKRARTSD